MSASAWQCSASVGNHTTHKAFGGRLVQSRLLQCMGPHVPALDPSALCAPVSGRNGINSLTLTIMEPTTPRLEHTSAAVWAVEPGQTYFERVGVRPLRRGSGDNYQPCGDFSGEAEGPQERPVDVGSSLTNQPVSGEDGTQTQGLPQGTRETDRSNNEQRKRLRTCRGPKVRLKKTTIGASAGEKAKLPRKLARVRECSV